MDEFLLYLYWVTKKKKKKKKTVPIYFWLKFINLIQAFSFFQDQKYILCMKNWDHSIHQHVRVYKIKSILLYFCRSNKKVYEFCFFWGGVTLYITLKKTKHPKYITKQIKKYVYLWVCLCIHMCVCVHLHVFLCVCRSICLCILMYLCVCVCGCVFVYLNVCMCVDICVCVCVCV